MSDSVEFLDPANDGLKSLTKCWVDKKGTSAFDIPSKRIRNAMRRWASAETENVCQKTSHTCMFRKFLCWGSIVHKRCKDLWPQRIALYYFY